MFIWTIKDVIGLIVFSIIGIVVIVKLIIAAWEDYRNSRKRKK